MKIFKKIFILVIIAMLSLGITGCNKNSSTDNSISPTTDSRSLFEKIRTNQLKNVAFESEVKIESEAFKTTMKSTGVYDFQNNKAVINNIGDGLLNQDSTIYLVDNKVYMLDPSNNQWQYTELNTDVNSLINKGLIVSSDKAYELMTFEKVGDGYLVKSKGTINIKEFLEAFNYNINNGLMFDDSLLNNLTVEFEYKLTKDYYPEEIKLTMSYNMAGMTYKTISEIKYSGYNQQKSIELPAEAKNAVKIGL